MVETSHWFGMLVLYGASKNFLPVFYYLCEHSEMVCVGNTEQNRFATYFVPEDKTLLANDLDKNLEIRPYAFMLGGKKPEEMSVPSRNATIFNWMQGEILLKEGKLAPILYLLKLNQRDDGKDDGQKKNYTTLIKNRVVSRLPGKWSISLAYLGVKSVFILSSRSLSLHLWLVYFDQAYFLFWSSNPNAVNELEMALGNQASANKEMFFQQEVPFPINSVLALHPMFLVNKFHKRLRTYVDRASRKLLICNFLRNYLVRQIVGVDNESKVENQGAGNRA